MAIESDFILSDSPQHNPHFVYSPHEDGRPIVLDGKAIAYIEEDAPPMTGEIPASSQDVREKLEEIAVYLQSSSRLKGCRKAERLADETLDLLARTVNPNYKTAGDAL